MWPFSKEKGILGIDIGTSSIKLVQLKKDNGIFKLEDYGELIVSEYLKSENALQTSTLKMQDVQVVQLLKKLIEISKVTTKRAVFSVPLFSSFVTLIEMPKMTMDEVANAISFEARQYVPVPINEVVLDWSVVGSVFGPVERSEALDVGQEPLKEEKLQVLLAAVPKEVVEKYHRISRLANLELVGLEIESFALAKAVTQKDSKSICILDIGARSTNICIVENGYVKLTHNIDTSGLDITKALANSLNVSLERAESLKREQGLRLGEIERDVFNVLTSMLDTILNEVEKYISLYSKKSNKNIETIILVGGSSYLPGLDGYIFEKLKIKTEIGNPFKKIQYPSVLNPIIKDLGPKFAIAIGLAMSY